MVKKLISAIYLTVKAVYIHAFGTFRDIKSRRFKEEAKGDNPFEHDSNGNVIRGVLTVFRIRTDT